jgi:hypothetical protein
VGPWPHIDKSHWFGRDCTANGTSAQTELVADARNALEAMTPHVHFVTSRL